MLPVIAFLLIVAVSAETGDEVDCTLAPETGLCQAYFPSYFFNSTSGQCEHFVYGGCQGNSNRFQSRRECEVVCMPDDGVDCNADPETGMCQAIIPRFFYDRVSGECKNFVYGGCGGNTNNFQTYDECSKKCGAIPPRDGPDCSSPAETGLCYAYFPRFFFNTESGRCERFIYGGCGGNDNSYDSEEDCQQKCGGKKEDHEVDCYAEAESGLCDAYMPMFHYDSGAGTCKKFIYGGCGGNTNRFGTFDQCMNKCHVKDEIVKKDVHEVDCGARAETGLCKAYIPSYHYDKTTKTCSQFIYGGCGGNSNRFSTIDQCMQKCHVPDVEEEDVDCDAEPETGMCRANFPMFYYNRATGSCQKFTYGGCGGNTNRFWDEEQCLNRCQVKKSKKNVDEVDCGAEAETGLCKAYIPSYHYDKTTKTCSQFIYGGCGGNSNRFSTFDQCMQKCHVPDFEEEEVDCDAEPETGMCRANFPMFYYDRATGSCQEFIYGGCGGNTNRFGDEEECLNRCQVKKAKKGVDCESKAETGFCRAYFPSYFYNKDTGDCEKFIYGGCGGNANRFGSYEQCLSACTN